MKGRDEPFRHLDRNTLVKLEEPKPNPLLLRVRAGEGRDTPDHEELRPAQTRQFSTSKVILALILNMSIAPSRTVASEVLDIDGADAAQRAAARH